MVFLLNYGMGPKSKQEHFCCCYLLSLVYFMAEKERLYFIWQLLNQHSLNIISFNSLHSLSKPMKCFAKAHSQTSTASPGSSLGMRVLRPHPILTGSEPWGSGALWVLTSLQVILMHIMESQNSRWRAITVLHFCSFAAKARDSSDSSGSSWGYMISHWWGQESNPDCWFLYLYKYRWSIVYSPERENWWQVKGESMRK